MSAPKRNIAKRQPVPAAPSWEPVTVSIPGWEQEARAKWKGVTAPVTPKYHGDSLWKRRMNDRIRQEATT